MGGLRVQLKSSQPLLRSWRCSRSCAPVSLKTTLQGIAPWWELTVPGPSFAKWVLTGQNESARGPQVLVLGSFYQGSMLGTYF